MGDRFTIPETGFLWFIPKILRGMRQRNPAFLGQRIWASALLSQKPGFSDRVLKFSVESEKETRFLNQRIWARAEINSNGKAPQRGYPCEDWGD